VIVTDDGLATGATMRAALWALRAEGPQRLIVAVPVGARQAVDMLADDCDEILCLRLPALFYAVGQFYDDFGQVTDEEVVSLLRGAHEMAGSR